MNRKLRMGMIGGGEGSFIGAVHRMAANLDGQIELACGCFSTGLGIPGVQAFPCSFWNTVFMQFIKR